jgi:3-methyladenine DNA glycosylase AlkD
MSNSKAIQGILKMLRHNATAAAVNATSKFVPTAACIIGNRMPFLNQIAKENKNANFELVALLWQCGFYETRILAAKLLGKIAKKDPLKAIGLVNHFSTEIDNWAVCDTLGMQSLKPVLKTHSAEIFSLSGSLIHSNNFWQRRLALVLAEWYTREKRFHTAILHLIGQLGPEEPFYVKKAVLWLKKNFDKGK